MARHRSKLSIAAVALLALAAPRAAHADSATAIVDRFAGAAIQTGYAEGIEVALVIGTAKPAFYSFGFADVATRVAPTPDTLFQIASVTKVFTTNLLGQAVHAGKVSLAKPLSDYTAQLGILPADTAAVTLEQLGDFTAGFPTYAPLCAKAESPGKTGCLPGTLRPTIAEYDGQDFAAFFRTYALAGAPPLPYLYSDYSNGLLGLLLGAPSGKPLSNTALTGWETLLSTQLLKPLHLTSTFVDVPGSAAARLAPGYTPAIATADVRAGGVAGLAIVDPGAGYGSAPSVVISGGGGSGATATAKVLAGTVTGFTITDAGKGYVAPPSVKFGSGAAKGAAIVQNGRIVGVNILAAGDYTAAPTVTFSGGRIGGHDATGKVFIDHDQVTYVQITDGGAGYVAPVTVAIAPALAAPLAVPIWAPAGALKTSARDLASFAAAALGHTAIGAITVPAGITAGFALAELPYACEGAAPALAGCTTPKSGLAWDINTATPELIAKNGGLPGYSSYLGLLPAQNTAIVVLANSRNVVGAADGVARDILGALYHEGLLPASP